jgi:hypothetical protein
MKLLKDTNWFIPLMLVILIALPLTLASQAADSTICDGTAGAAYGLCTAYCEAMDCESDNPQASEIACERVYSNYSKITGGVPPCAVTEMIVFVTSTSYDGLLGGLYGADLKCQTQAVAAGLPGTYKAWLSDSTTDANQRLAHSTLPYVTVDGVRIADNWDDLVGSGGEIENTLNITEYGVEVSAGASVWTATAYAGNKTGCDPAICGGFCEDWTDSTSGIAMVGNPHEINRQWTEALTWDWLPGYIPAQSCSSLQHLYCFQQ